MPEWLHILAIVSLVIALACSLIIIVDLFRHKQHMWIMNIV